MAVVEVVIVPLGTGSTSLSSYVAGCHRVLEDEGEGLVCQLTAMGTIIEGDLEQILAVVRRMHEVPFGEGALRVSTSIRIDDRRDLHGSIEQKVTSVEAKLK